MKPKNFDTAKELIEQYRSISLQLIKDKWKMNAVTTLYDITGFGNIKTCTLCAAVGRDIDGAVMCNRCIYNYFTEDAHIACNADENAPTYAAILYAQDPEQLLSAILRRADHIESILWRLYSNVSPRKSICG
jgi:hypothetical protein